MNHDLFTGLTPSTPDSKTTTLAYYVDDVRKIPGVVVTEPYPGAFLAVRVSACGTFVDFAGLEWQGEDDLGAEARILFQGNGTGGGLREMRHTNFGPDRDGYVFYLPINKTIALLGALREFFDADD